MKVCLGKINGKPVMLELQDGIAYIDGEAQPIKNLSEDDLMAFQAELDALPKGGEPGHDALADAVRASFIASLLGKAVGEECVNRLTNVLDHVHYNVLQYLGETGEE